MALLSSAVTLFTSLPPRVEGATARDPALLRGIRESWRDPGFSAVSVNSRLEHQLRPDLRRVIADSAMAAVVVDRPDAAAVRSVVDRDPLCTMSELLGAMHRHVPNGVVGIVNADIGRSRHLSAESIAAIVAGGRSLLGQRLDVKEIPHEDTVPDGIMDLHGADFVAFPSAVIPALVRILPPILRFGRPWWDHYLPLSLLLLGVAPRMVAQGSLWHVTHPQRWSMRSWERSGVVAARQFSAALSGLPPSRASQAWLRLYRGRFDPGGAINAGDRVVRRLLDASICPGPLLRSRLGVLAGGNVALLLQSAAAE